MFQQHLEIVTAGKRTASTTAVLEQCSQTRPVRIDRIDCQIRDCQRLQTWEIMDDEFWLPPLQWSVQTDKEVWNKMML